MRLSCTFGSSWFWGSYVMLWRIYSVQTDRERTNNCGHFIALLLLSLNGLCIEFYHLQWLPQKHKKCSRGDCSYYTHLWLNRALLNTERHSSSVTLPSLPPDGGFKKCSHRCQIRCGTGCLVLHLMVINTFSKKCIQTRNVSFSTWGILAGTPKLKMNLSEVKRLNFTYLVMSPINLSPSGNEITLCVN